MKVKKELPQMREFSCLRHPWGQGKRGSGEKYQSHKKGLKTNKSTGNSSEFPVLLVETAGLEPVTSCV